MARELDMTLAKMAQDKTCVKETANISNAKAYSAKVARKRKRNDAIITALLLAFCVGAYAYIVLDAFNLPSLLIRMANAM